MISCVSQKKYAALEEQCSVERDFDRKLDEIIALRRDAAQSSDQMIDYKMEMMQLKNEIANLKTIDQMAAEGHLNGIPPEQLREELVNASRTQSHDALAKEMEQFNCQPAMRASVEIEAIAMLIGDRVQKNHQEIRIAKNNFDAQIMCPNATMFTGIGALTSAGTEIVNGIRQVVDVKSGYTIVVKIETGTEGITEAERKQANAIVAVLMAYSGRNTVKTEVQFVPKLNKTDEITLVVKY